MTNLTHKLFLSLNRYFSHKGKNEVDNRELKKKIYFYFFSFSGFFGSRYFSVFFALFLFVKNKNLFNKDLFLYLIIGLVNYFLILGLKKLINTPRLNYFYSLFGTLVPMNESNGKFSNFQAVESEDKKNTKAESFVKNRMKFRPNYIKKIIQDFYIPDKYRTPSGHCANGIINSLFLYFFCKGNLFSNSIFSPTGNFFWVLFLSLLFLLVLGSRFFLLIHTLSDCLLGTVIGVLVFSLVYSNYSSVLSWFSDSIFLKSVFLDFLFV